MLTYENTYIEKRRSDERTMIHRFAFNLPL